MPEEVLNEHYSMIEAIASTVIAKQKLPLGTEFTDLVNWGVEGLHKAYNGYKENKGTQFKSYAFLRIRGEILDSLRKEWKYRFPQQYKDERQKAQDRIADIVENMLEAQEKPGNGDLNIPLIDVISNASISPLVSIDNAGDIMDSHKQDEHTKDMIELLKEELETIDDDEKTFIKLFYIHGYSQKEVASKMKYSPSKMCRIHMKILEKLRRRLERVTEEV